MDEEVGGANVPLATPTEEKALLLSPTLESEEKRRGEQKTWDEIIPASMLEQVEAEERQKEELQLYLPPRQRTVQVRRSTDTLLALLTSANTLDRCPLPHQNYCEDQQSLAVAARSRSNGGRARGARGRRERVSRRNGGQKDTTDPSDRSTVVRKTIRGFTNSEIRK